jgi:3-(3-hydroxy-phenyl)propionate hydroxylase
MYDVAIIGYGPVGATFANLLSKYGLSLAVVEQAAGIYDKPRAITIDHEVLRALQACGLSDYLETSTVPHPGTHYLGVDGEIIKIFDPLPPPYPLGWVPTANFVQPELEQALRNKLSAYEGADIFLSTCAVEFAQDADGVSLQVKSPDGTERALRARYLVACDGANSFARKQLGIELEDLAFDEWWMVVDAFAQELTKRPRKCFQYCWPSRPGTYLPGPGALRRWEIKLLPGETPEKFGRRDNVLEVLSGFTDTSDLEIWRSAVYRFHALVARVWHVGRIFLMGDAVHQTPPFLGQGLCAGIRDAFNLAWKLAFVISGKAGPGLLETYEAERKPHVRAIVAAAKEFGKIIGELDPAKARARDRALREELVSGRAQTIRQKYIPDLAAGLIASHAKLAGSLFVQPGIRRGDGRCVRLDDLLAPGFAIFATSAEPMAWLSERSLAFWEQLGGERIVIGCGPHEPVSGIRVFTEEGRLFADWLAGNEVGAVVVRPDRYVFGGAQDAEQLNALVGELASGLRSDGQGIGFERQRCAGATL